MKVGDRVQPSARVLSQQGFYWLTKETLGLVIRKPRTMYGTWQVQWYGNGHFKKQRTWNMRREWLKYAKAKK